MALMAQKTILSTSQQQLLEHISTHTALCKSFYLSGGTALAEFYLHHRLSEDLDFFSEHEIDAAAIFAFLKSLQPLLGIEQIAPEQSFNRNLYFLHLKSGEIIKTEFTHFPFTRMEKGMSLHHLAIDSLRDIAVNKLFTIYQKPRARDFIDLFMILQKQTWTLKELMRHARTKFDWHIDPLQLGSQYLQAATLKDYPRMIVPLDHALWQQFFVDAAQQLKKNILT